MSTLSCMYLTTWAKGNRQGRQMRVQSTLLSPPEPISYNPILDIRDTRRYVVEVQDQTGLGEALLPCVQTHSVWASAHTAWPACPSDLA